MKIIALAAAVIALSAPAFAHAQGPQSYGDDRSTQTVAVHYGDLDLSQPRDAVRVIDRLDRASLEACGASEFSYSEYRASVRDSECYRASMQQGVAATNSPVVASLYNHRSETTTGSR